MHIAQMLTANGAITDEKCALAKEEMLSVIVKLDSMQINDEQGKTQHDSNTPNYVGQVEKRNPSIESRNMLDPVRKKRTGEATGRLKNALEKMPQPKRKTTSKTSESVPVVLPNQDFNFPDYSLNQMNQSYVRNPTYQVGHIGMPLMPSDHPFIYNQSTNIAIDVPTQPAKRLDFIDFSVLERGAGRTSLDPSL